MIRVTRVCHASGETLSLTDVRFDSPDAPIENTDAIAVMSSPSIFISRLGPPSAPHCKLEGICAWRLDTGEKWAVRQRRDRRREDRLLVGEVLSDQREQFGRASGRESVCPSV